jgi:hypothetical protein
MQVLERKPIDSATGRWVNERDYAAHFGIARQTLANWRWLDLQAGRSEAAPGFPRYRRFGRAIRYWLDDGGPVR